MSHILFLPLVISEKVSDKKTDNVQNGEDLKVKIIHAFQQQVSIKVVNKNDVLYTEKAHSIYVIYLSRKLIPGVPKKAKLYLITLQKAIIQLYKLSFDFNKNTLI